MKILAFDATIPSLSVKNGETITTKMFPTSDEMKHEVVSIFDRTFNEIRIFKGPGSFTGLRVAHALALGLSVSSGIPIRQMDLSKRDEPLIIPFKGNECFCLCGGEVRVIPRDGSEFKGAISELLLLSDFGVLTPNPEPFYGVETHFKERNA